MSNPIIVHDQPATGTAETTKTDGTPVRRIYHYCDMKHMPRGIEMKEYVHSDGSITFIGQYFNKKNAQPTNRPKRVYRVEVRELPKLYASEVPDWCAAVWEDDVRLVKIVGNSKWNVCYAALGALRGILHKRCAHTGGNRRRRRKASALNPVNPVNPVQNKEIA